VSDRFTVSFERAARFIFSGFTLMAAILFYYSSRIPADDGLRGMDADEYRHLTQALAFIDASTASSDSLPSASEFNTWTSEMDQRGYHYDGTGFTYTRFSTGAVTHEKTGCWDSVHSGRFSLSFWDGERQINIYPNKQNRYLVCSAPENYSFGRPIPWARIAFLMAMCMLAISFWRAFRVRPPSTA
jgi:hypothetical protein